MKKVLNAKFFERPAPIVAKDLLGKYLVRKIGNKEIASKIVETEAYEGLHDLASHASKGETARTKVMFGKPGRFYIYFVYGMHNMLNIVTGQNGHPSAVLIRGLEEVNGPGKLTKKLDINRDFNTLHAIPENNLWFEDRGFMISSRDISKTPRVGVEYAGPIWSKKLWRFLLKK